MGTLYWMGRTITRILSKGVFRIKSSGQENFPREGGFIMAVNHISYYDPPIAGSWAPRTFHFMAKRELFGNSFFGTILRKVNAFPVNRAGMDREAIKEAIRRIKSGDGLVVFPEGTRSKTGKLKKPKAGIGMLSRAANCPIVPAYLYGSNALKECFWGKRHMRVMYGEPISAEWVASRPKGKEGYNEIAEEVMKRISKLQEMVTGVK